MQRLTIFLLFFIGFVLFAVSSYAQEPAEADWGTESSSDTPEEEKTAPETEISDFIEEKQTTKPIKVRYIPFSDIAQFSKDIEEFAKRTGNKSDATLNGAVSTFNALSTENQTVFLQTFQHLIGKSAYMEAPKQYLECVALAVGKLSEDKLTEFLKVTEASSALYRPWVTKQFLRLIKNHLQGELILDAKGGAMSVKNGTISFMHVTDESLADKKLAKDFLPEATTKEEWYEHLEETPKDDEKKEDEFLKPEDIPVSTPSTDDWGADPYASDWGADKYTSESEGSATDWGTESYGGGSSTASFMPIIPKKHVEIPLPPPISGPYIRIENADITLYTPYDTVTIEATSGDLLARDFHFVGKGGRFYFPDLIADAYVDLDSYFFNARRPKMWSEGAKLTFAGKTESPIEGEFFYEVSPDNRTPKATFPAFISYKNDVKLEGIAKGVVYEGGFAIKGQKLYGTSLEKGINRIEVEKDGNTKFIARSYSPFFLSDTLIKNPCAQLTIYHSEKDSLFHPGLRIKFQPDSGYLQADRVKGVNSRALFNDNAIKVNIDAQRLLWNINTDTAILKNIFAPDIVPAIVESEDRFDVNLYNRLRKLYGFHPLKLIVNYGKMMRTHHFYVDELVQSKEMKRIKELDRNQVFTAMQELANLDFIAFDPQLGRIELKRKAYFYVYANERYTGVVEKKIDYDHIIIKSKAEEGGVLDNMTLNIPEKHLTVYGVSSFFLSDTLLVRIKPENKTIKITANRDMVFSGEVNAGKFILRVDTFYFNYDQFSLFMNGIKEFSLLVPDSITGKPTEMQNSIQSTAGVLYVGLPKNKCGLVPTPNYPRFDASLGGSIKFTGKEVLNGVYDERIEFEMPPFDVDSINASDPASMNFVGKFKSSGMFPDFEQRAMIMSDYSFGFIHNFQSEGVPLFAGKAKYYNQITMDNRGIRGKGEIEYLTGNFQSEDFVFFSDSVRTQGKYGVITNSAKYPNVELPHYNMRWLVNDDRMELSTTDTTFSIFDTEAQFGGTLFYTPDSLGGKGKFRTEGASIESPQFRFEPKAFESRNSIFKIESPLANKPFFTGLNTHVAFDKTNRKANLYNENDSLQSFIIPYSRYKTGLTKAVWDINKKRIEMTTPPFGKPKAKFTPIAGGDGPEMEGTTAVYDIQADKLNIEGVDTITLIGAAILPNKGKVSVGDNGNIDVLTQAKVYLNGTTKYHYLYNADVTIKNKNSFTGSGTYDYVNSAKQKFSIPFSLGVSQTVSKKAGVTAFTGAYTTIREDDNVKIFPGIKYRGLAILKDNDPFVNFVGEVALDIDRDNNSWYSVKTTNDSSAGILDTEIIRTADLHKPRTGIFFHPETHDLVFSFVEYRTGYERLKPVFEADGKLFFDTKKNMFKIDPKEQKDKHKTAGNELDYFVLKDEMTVAGEFKMLDNTKDFTLLTVGDGDGYNKKQEYELDVFLAAKMDLKEEAFKYILSAFLADSASYEPQKSDSLGLIRHLAEALSSSNFEKARQTIENGEIISFAKYFPDYTFVFPYIPFQWSSNRKAFYSKDLKVELSSVYKRDINLSLNTYVEIPKIDPADGELLSSAFRLFVFNDNISNWLYVSYDGKSLHTLSSSSYYNGVVQHKKGGKNTQLVEAPEVMQFVNNYRAYYLNNSEPIVIMEPGIASAAEIKQEEASVKNALKSIKKGKTASPTEEILSDSPETPLEGAENTEIIPTKPTKSKKTKVKKDTIPDETDKPAEEKKDESDGW